MPVVFRYKGFRFFFYSNEGNPREPPHVHIRQGESAAKFWLKPTVSLANAYGMSASELNELEIVITANREMLERSWNEYFG
jgi:Domain of unknown function (DUF4160)